MTAATAARWCCGWVALGALLAVACSKGVTDEAIPASPGVPTGPCSNEGEVQSCYPAAPETRSIGTCHDGTVTCVEGQWSDCDGYQGPEAEVCSDQIDNDCDGLVDEGCGCEPGATQKCYGGSPTTVGIGECRAGVQSCTGGVWSSSCDGEVLPATETCDGLDQDCNGVADDGCGCGDSQCDSGEDCNSCPADCGACPPTCGDSQCDSGEDCNSCPGDCGACPPICGDNQCNGSEDCNSCPGDCGACPPTCGDNQCNGSEDCNSCPGDCGTCGCPWGTTGENGDPCPNVPSQTWRCVFIPSWNTNGSQVCRVDPLCPTSAPCWLTYHLNPADCANCCDAYTSACD